MTSCPRSVWSVSGLPVALTLHHCVDVADTVLKRRLARHVVGKCELERNLLGSYGAVCKKLDIVRAEIIVAPVAQSVGDAYALRYKAVHAEAFPFDKVFALPCQ